MAQHSNMTQPEDWGDYISEEYEEYVTGATEGFDAYVVRVGPPGPPCYPVTIGEIIQGGGKSYRIEHKLGFGAYSTIWLAYEIETNTSVALKIHRTLTTAGQAESQIHQDLQRLITDPSDCHLLIATSTFSLPGQFPDDTHVVVVLPVMGPPLDIRMRPPVYRPDSSTRLRMARDILQAVAFLHRHKFIHRDITDRNVMVSLVPGAFDQGPTPTERYKQVGRPEKFPMPVSDMIWRPGDLVSSIEWPWSMVGKTAFLGDFGLTRHIDSPATDHALPPFHCCPPELFHEGFEPTYESDMWGFMCVFTTLMTAFSPFDTYDKSGTLGSMFDMLGPLPQEWKGRYRWPNHYPEEERSKWYDDSRVPEDSLEGLLGRTREDLGPRERELILDVMHKGFRYQPSQRIGAQQLLDDDSFRELMSIHGIK
ncbi:hypothetical protein KVR01_005991 [Diaporthe batatas]|uniref:uncharacterized protein n=1 Tax=Diaporthe batatas TaxID=748121 RepID=UPI001D03E916|nr:uncharacterized protein KVR01_005991 [Diaporthe batatas]KAG8164073.1 hypothetical protein KVR01_005991 [Diaporthe batatas]